MLVRKALNMVSLFNGKKFSKLYYFELKNLELSSHFFLLLIIEINLFVTPVISEMGEAEQQKDGWSHFLIGVCNKKIENAK